MSIKVRWMSFHLWAGIVEINVQGPGGAESACWSGMEQVLESLLL